MAAPCLAAVCERAAARRAVRGYWHVPHALCTGFGSRGPTRRSFLARGSSTGGFALRTPQQVGPAGKAPASRRRCAPRSSRPRGCFPADACRRLCAARAPLARGRGPWQEVGASRSTDEGEARGARWRIGTRSALPPHLSRDHGSSRAATACWLAGTTRFCAACSRRAARHRGSAARLCAVAAGAAPQRGCTHPAAAPPTHSPGPHN